MLQDSGGVGSVPKSTSGRRHHHHKHWFVFCFSTGLHPMLQNSGGVGFDILSNANHELGHTTLKPYGGVGPEVIEVTGLVTPPLVQKLQADVLALPEVWGPPSICLP
jgi:hypothetical protein